MKILFATSEAHPLIKTGGLADVCGSLPDALRALGHDVRVVMPAYPLARARAGDPPSVGQAWVAGAARPVDILAAVLESGRVPIYLVHSPAHFDREGGPYTHPDGHDWPDNAQRFALFSRVVVELAMGRAGLDWCPDIVHGHDWQTGLVPAILSLENNRPGSIFTIHNLSYQGVFAGTTFAELQLPRRLWTWNGLEYYDQVSFIKGGLAYADKLTTVSPTYAKEIRTEAFGYGLHTLLEHRAADLHGILNGVDYNIWDPRLDPRIVANYGPDDLAGKALNKSAVQRRFALPEHPDVPLLGHVGRLVHQKGIDLLLDTLPQLLRRPLQVVTLGTGEPELERALYEAASSRPDRIAVEIGYSERLAHLLEAGCDMFVMPSRFEPCGLNQIYSLRYGTLPIVHRTGGLADTVVDADPANLAAGRATGFVFQHPDPPGVAWAINQALDLYTDRRAWQRVMLSAMAQDFSWNRSAREYARLYSEFEQRALTRQPRPI
jgi:starch synthase